MCPRERVRRVSLLIIAIIGLSTMTTTSSAAAIAHQPKLLILRLSPEKPAKSLDDIPDSWRTVGNNGYQVPQMEIHLLKGHVSPDENWYYMNEYKYSGPDYDTKTSSSEIGEEKIISRLGNDREETKGNAREENDDRIVMPDTIIPMIDSRNIIHTPTFCQEGERPDSKGRCRPVLE